MFDAFLQVVLQGFRFVAVFLGVVCIIPRSNSLTAHALKAALVTLGLHAFAATIVTWVFS